ncbi:MAG: hypothetical protein BEN19_05010 [Epulopiscium sp. Nuni2H_MBin003]|nr:MAG: hypothetical protein BEN19_05010 [Epulopiscium sp. Nuni2H_MBin003]
MKIFFIRHLKTQGNLEKRYIGSTDEDILADQTFLTDLPENPTKIYVSPMKRCIQTAKLIYKDHTLEIVEEFREIDFGEFENKTYDDLKDDINYRNFLDGKSSPPKGEEVSDFKQRCIAGFMDITKRIDNDSIIVIVCHGGTIMAIMEALEVQQKSFYSYQISNGDILETEYRDKKIYVQG